MVAHCHIPGLLLDILVAQLDALFKSGPRRVSARAVGAYLGVCPSNGGCTYRSISGIIVVKASEGGTDEQGVSPL